MRAAAGTASDMAAVRARLVLPRGASERAERRRNGCIPVLRRPDARRESFLWRALKRAGQTAIAWHASGNLGECDFEALKWRAPPAPRAPAPSSAGVTDTSSDRRRWDAQAVLTRGPGGHGFMTAAAWPIRPGNPMMTAGPGTPGRSLSPSPAAAALTLTGAAATPTAEPRIIKLFIHQLENS